MCISIFIVLSLKPIGVELLAQRIPQYQDEETASWFTAQYEDLSKPNSEKHQWLVTALRPYTKYHFKVIFDISPDLTPFETQTSLVVLTKPGGKPSKPILHKVEQVS